jgi:hypothetical protein
VFLEAQEHAFVCQSENEGKFRMLEPFETEPEPITELVELFNSRYELNKETDQYTKRRKAISRPNCEQIPLFT